MVSLLCVEGQVCQCDSLMHQRCPILHPEPPQPHHYLHRLLHFVPQVDAHLRPTRAFTPSNEYQLECVPRCRNGIADGASWFWVLVQLGPVPSRARTVLDGRPSCAQDRCCWSGPSLPARVARRATPSLWHPTRSQNAAHDCPKWVACPAKNHHPQLLHNEELYNITLGGIEQNT